VAEIFLPAGAVLLLIVLGGAVAADATSVGQFMISRPIVAATLAGWIAGDPLNGALLGLVLEAFQLSVLPVGAARYPEAGPAAVAGGASFAAGNPAPSTLLLTVTIVLLLEWIGGESIRQLRHLNVRLASSGNEGLLDAAAVERRHLAAIGLDFLRGMLLVAGGYLVLAGLLHFLTPLWGLGERLPLLLLTATVAGLLTSTVHLIGWRGWLFSIGGAGGLLLLLAAE
jgi:mannose/fructose/N-acetylgalactosamine-specific phosphotransferase system component IIC